MKIEELRIGNLILDSGLVLVVKGVYRDGRTYVFEVENLGFDETPTRSDISEAKGVPLTEEWLLKFGFEVCLGSAKKDNFKMGQPDDDFITESWSIRYEKKYVKIQYVHQLQNLYFALTQTELTLKP